MSREINHNSKQVYHKNYLHGYKASAEGMMRNRAQHSRLLGPKMIKNRALSLEFFFLPVNASHR